MKCSGITWQELEDELGVAAGPDFSAGITEDDLEADQGLLLLAREKQWNRNMEKVYGVGYLKKPMKDRVPINTLTN